ncbi:MAG TPA: acyl carrier protein [Terriglobia bacterium]|nr:acyl carrier protein [Terriglobia bacterium]
MDECTREDAIQRDIAPETVRQDIVSLIRDMMKDWDIDPALTINLETALVADLEFGSVDVIYLVVAIEERFRRPRMGFQSLLMRDGRYVDDLTVGQLADFVTRKLSGAES